MTEAINIAAYSDALVILGTAGIVVPLVRKLGVSPVIGYLGAGALLGPLGLGSFVGDFPFLSWFSINDTGNVSGFADLGVVFLFFLIGLELSFDRLVAMRRLVFGLGGLQIALTMTLLSVLAWLTGQRPTVAIILGASLALSSTAIVLDMFSNQGRILTGAGRASISVLLAQDLAVIPLLMFISILGSHADESLIESLGQALVQAVLAVSVIVLAGRALLRPIFRLVGSLRSEELFIAAVLFVIIAIGVIASVAGLSMALGAFIAGLLLAETEYRKAIHAAIKPFQGILLGIFFFTVGMNIDPHALAREPLLILTVVTALIAIKALVLIILSKIFKMTWSAAIETGLLLGAGGEFAFVILTLASALGLIGADITRFTLAVASLTMVLIPLLSVLALRIDKFLEKQKTPDPELAVLPTILQKHAIVIGYGRVGKVVSTLLERHGVPYTATDYDARMVAKDRRNGLEVFYGDAANRAFLEACGLMQATGVIITINSYPIIDEIIRQVREMRPDIIIVSRARDAAHAKHMYEMGVTDAVPETIEASLQLSEAALVAFGVPTGFAIASVHEQRDEFRKELQLAARLAGTEESHGMRAKSV